MTAAEQAAARLSETFPESVVVSEKTLDMPTVIASSEALIDVLRWLRDDGGFDLLSDLSSVDWLPRRPRFHVNYHLRSTKTGDAIRVKAFVDSEDGHLPSAVELWRAADWQEREVYDLMGIRFTGHPNLTRIQMPDEWEGHPLRKDYPIGGVPVEYRIEPAYAGSDVTPAGRPAAGGAPPRLIRDRGRRSRWTWTGPPASGVRQTDTPDLGPPGPGDEEPSE